MSTVSRRTFLGVSLGGLAAIGHDGTARAAVECAASKLPSRLAIDCSVGQNMRLFLNNQSRFGLAGVVSMTAFHMPLGSFAAGSLFLYPWFKSQKTGAALITELSQYEAFLPGPTPANPLPNVGTPLDEELCVYCLQTPVTNFIGFSVDVPQSGRSPRLPWYSVVDRVGSQSVGVDWTSSNLNGRWFAGNSAIPASNACDGHQWRSLIVDGLRRASTMSC